MLRFRIYVRFVLLATCLTLVGLYAQYSLRNNAHDHSTRIQQKTDYIPSVNGRTVYPIVNNDWSVKDGSNVNDVSGLRRHPGIKVTTKVRDDVSGLRRTRHSKDSFVYRTADPYTYNYVIDPSPWTQRCNNLSVLYYLHSSVINDVLRNKIRSKWTNSSSAHKLNIGIVFMVGLSKNASVNDAVQRENDQYGDIIQEDYIDAYHNMSLKAISAMKFVHTFCGRVPLILKTDDDVDVDEKLLEKFINDELPKMYFNTDKVIMCNMWTYFPDRHRRSKWMVTKEEYRYPNYPVFCQGAAFLLTSAAVHSIFDATFGQELYRYDDVFLTGILSQKAGVSIYGINNKYNTESRPNKYKFKPDAIFSTVFTNVVNSSVALHL